MDTSATSKIRKLCVAILSLVAVAIMPVSALADGFLTATSEHGGFNMTFRCYYEPSQHAVMTDIMAIEETSTSDTLQLSIPATIVQYNDTFPVTGIKLSSESSKNWKCPKVLDLSGMHNPFSSISQLIRPNLEELILGQDTDSLLFSVSNTNISRINAENLTYLRKEAFAYTPKLRKIIVSKELKVIPDKCFMNSGIKRLEAEGVTSIGEYAFERSKLSDIELPIVENIGFMAFHRCTSLKEISLNPGLKSVEANAFNGTKIERLDLHKADVKYTRQVTYVDRPSLEIISPWHLSLPDSLPNLSSIKSDSLKYLPFVNKGMIIDCPRLEAVKYKSLNNLDITSFPILKQLILDDCAVNKLVIPDSLLNGIGIHRALIYGDSYIYDWTAFTAKNSVIDSLSIGRSNVSFIVKDSILLSIPPQRPTDLPFPIIMMDFPMELRNLDGDAVILRGYRNPNPDYIPPTDTIAVAAVGFPRGEWFVPKNNRWGGVTFCCDYVDNIRLNPSFDPKGYYLRTYTRPESDRIKVYIDLPTSKAGDIKECCASPLMDFYVPKGMLGRFIAAGLPADRTFEDTEGIVGIEGVETDPTVSAPRGTFTIDGRRVPDGATLAPGFYIIDGRKTYIR